MKKEDEKKLIEARKEFKNRPKNSYIYDEFKKLKEVFFEVATEQMKDEYWNTPLFDKPNYIEGKSQEQMDKEFNDIINQ